MGLKTCEIIFGGVSCRKFGLIVADLGGLKDNESTIAAVPVISDESVPRQYKPYFYGVTRPNKQEMQVELLLSDDRIDTGRYLNRDEINQVSGWLTSSDVYQKLQVVQYESSDFYYKCICTGLQVLFVGGSPCGFSVTFTCDSAYAYRPEAIYQSGLVMPGSSMRVESLSIDISDCALPKYYPVITIEFENGGGNFSLYNEPPVGIGYRFTEIPSQVSRIVIDGQHRTLTATPGNINLYQNFDFRFPWLQNGKNQVQIINNSATNGLRCNIATEIPVIVGS